MRAGKSRLTTWTHSSTPPIREGEYNANWQKDPTIMRWWNGKQWSRPYTHAATPEQKRIAKSWPIESGVLEHLYYRGLVNNPNNKRKKKNETNS